MQDFAIILETKIELTWQEKYGSLKINLPWSHDRMFLPLVQIYENLAKKIGLSVRKNTHINKSAGELALVIIVVNTLSLNSLWKKRYITNYDWDNC